MRIPSALPPAVFAVLALTACGMLAPPKPKLLTSEGGGFEIMTPITLKEETQNAPSPIGNITVHMYSGERDNSAYVVGYSDYPEALIKMSPADTLLDGARDGAIKSFHGKITEEKKITLDGNPGREFNVDARLKEKIDANMKARIYLVKNRLYQVLVVGEKGKLSTADMDSFVESFKLVKK